MKYFPKYGDYFGNVMTMGYENLGLEFMTFDEKEWSYERKISYASKFYYWFYYVTLEESLAKVKLERSTDTDIAIAKNLKQFFGDDAYFHFILKGRQQCQKNVKNTL